ncbi:putative reverse transcriptase domain-containing protein, partial [Tanacetum coccineum]
MEDSLPPPVPDLPLVSPFLCSDDSEADSESEPAEQRPERHESLVTHDAMVLRWRDRVASRPLLTARKRVGPIPARRLAWRRVSHHSSDHYSSPDSSSSSSPSDHSLSRHTPPDTTDADTSTPPRFVHRSLARTPRRCEAFRRWRSAPLSTPYPPTTLESSLGSSSERSLDSSSPSSRPSCKRCRSLTASVPSPTYVLRLISPTPADLLPPCKRFRDSYSPEDSGEEHMEVDTADAEAVADVDISDGVVAHTENGVGMGVKITASDVREDDEEFEAEASVADRKEIDVDPLAIGDSFESSRGGIHDLEDIVYDIVYYMSEVRIDRIIEIETTQRQLETKALAAYEEARAANALEAENQSQNGNDGNNGNGGNENGGNGNGGNGNPYKSGRGDRLVAREGTYQDFIKCQPLNFKGTEGVVGLIMWFKKTETVFHINNCPEKYQVKYATCTLLNSALTWWNSHKRTIGTEAAFTMSWRELMKLMAEVYCPINEIQKMEFELWNLSVKNNDLAAYT